MTIYQLATLAGQQIAALGYERKFHKNIMNCKSAVDVVNLWVDFLIDHGGDEDFKQRVGRADNLQAVSDWCRAAQVARDFE